MILKNCLGLCLGWREYRHAHEPSASALTRATIIDTLYISNSNFLAKLVKIIFEKVIEVTFPLTMKSTGQNLESRQWKESLNSIQVTTTRELTQQQVFCG
jgi:hypothetical protein